MTALATHNLDADQLDLLALIADTETPLGKHFADAFRDACRAEADIAGDFDGDNPAGPFGWINPNRVRERLIDRPDYEPRSYSAKWSLGFLVKTDRDVQIDASHSRGNGGKSVFFRRWQEAA